ncbi:16S rRNA (guanine(527)-N(7))-methyltransferase RsmG [Chitinophaga agri]|uniref:Ribosomal RNA small subunit methyltransferase G n=1 Tax=Chitinophaga agri TaxID=2703787 RepID=A0A6B9ZGP1_9BACT|nr:16S rRNA (guanine(527)-N(7))-methyltransferase RsmG [Chitinophaga agri]QHS60651.1 16S rRNA (guanine(527)-N(7))-methyltransferase RsmG [Chitinophaga agri]
MEIVLKYFSDFTDTQLQQLQALSGLYQEWNEKINVISRKDIESLYEKHVLHSLSIAAVAEFPDGMQILDLGTGGGFPGIPLAIFFPQVKFHLVDSIGKKIKVVQGVSEALGLQNVTYQHTRVEEIKDRKFDLVVSRAVAPLKDLWRWSKPVLKKAPAHEQQPGLICLKGGDLTEEVAESGVRPRLTNIYKLFPEDFFLEKHIVVVNK